ncbi:hypothetical protein [uncultured Thiodictyon sp.]|uniref:hypothetical protein n=1 Tax=uncultured Thiodictyon sp. TaxID=1846217 RepID=UPI0025E382BB|nr:hypothetical protein [uncultured Thiodictyon sp.]
MSLSHIDTVLTDEQRNKVKAALATVSEELNFLVDLNPKERAERPKFGEKNRSFVAKAVAIAEANPEILPGGFNIAELRNDVQMVEALYPILHTIRDLLGKVEDTYFAAGSGAYADALLIYQYAKLRNIATGALEDSLGDLGRRFARKSRKVAAAA